MRPPFESFRERLGMGFGGTQERGKRMATQCRVEFFCENLKPGAGQTVGLPGDRFSNFANFENSKTFVNEVLAEIDL